LAPARFTAPGVFYDWCRRFAWNGVLPLPPRALKISIGLRLFEPEAWRTAPRWQND
jgi:hypothetical protein